MTTSAKVRRLELRAVGWRGAAAVVLASLFISGCTALRLLTDDVASQKSFEEFSTAQGRFNTTILPTIPEPLRSQAAQANQEAVNAVEYSKTPNVVPTVATAFLGGIDWTAVAGGVLGLLGVGGAVRETVRRRRVTKTINDAILADPDTDEVLAERLNGDLKPEAREKVKRKREQRIALETQMRTRADVEHR